MKKLQTSVKGILGMTLVLSMVMGLTGCGGSAHAVNETISSAASAKEKNTESKNGSAPGNQIIIKFASVGSEDTIGNMIASELIPYLEEISGGTMTLELYANSALGDNRVIVEGVQLGTIEMAIPSNAILGGFTDTALLFDLPYLFDSYDSAYKVLTSDYAAGILDSLDSYGMIGVGYAVNGWRNLTANEEIRTPDELKGKKIRTMESQIHIDFFNELGASATPMSFSELYTALQQGVVDCQENPFITGTSGKLEEVQKYWIKTEHVLDISPIMFSKAFWDGLTEEQQGWILQFIDKFVEMNWERVRSYEKELEDKLADNGYNVIVELTDEEKQAFKDIPPIYSKYQDRIGKDLIESIKKMQEEN